MEFILGSQNNQLCLKWNGFTNNILTSLESSLGNQEFVDVTLVCEEGSVQAHRLILSACSSFFQRILKQNICPHPVIVLKGIAFSELETLLMFIYHGEARTCQDNIPRLLEVARFLEITGLSSQECNQVTPEPMVTNEQAEINKVDEDVLHSGVHSTTQEFNDLVSTGDLLNPYVSTKPQLSNENENREKHNERLDINIKREPFEENELTIKDPEDKNGPTIFSQIPLFSKTTSLEDKTNLCIPKTNFSVQEMLVLQQQKKLAFYEPRPCPKCHRTYRDAATLRNHLSSMHEVLRHKISCSCGSLFSTKHDLYVHRKRDHKGLV